jgi:hypothetical protein
MNLKCDKCDTCDKAGRLPAITAYEYNGQLDGQITFLLFGVVFYVLKYAT